MWLVAGLSGALVFWRLYSRAFPEASIQLRITPQQALQIGESALKQLDPQINLKGWRSAVVFESDSNAKHYLEKTLGLERANRLMQREVSTWYYECRWKRHRERLQYFAHVAPAGVVVSAGIRLPDEARLPTVSAAQARQIAERFLTQQLRLELGQWRLVERYEQKRPNRVDYTFTYEHRSRKYPPNADTPATLRTTLVVQGNRVGYYRLNRLWTPQKWHFEQDRYENRRWVIQTAAEVPYLLLRAVLFGVLIYWLVKRVPLAWRFAWRGVLLLVAIYLLTALNYLPLWWADYDPSKREVVYLLARLVFVLSGTFQIGLWSLVLLVTADALSRQQPPAGMRLALMATGSFWTTREVARGLLVGLCFAGVHLGYVTLLYLLGRQVGVWTPLIVPYTDAVATPLPFLEPVFYGLEPAILEETFSRVAAIYLLWRVVRHFWLAAFISSVIWAFLHTLYPTEPVYMRGLELTIIALLMVWVAFRYGLVATIASHYTYNALLTATAFWHMDAPYLWLSTALAVLAPALLLLPAAMVYLRRRTLPSIEQVQPLPEGTAPSGPTVSRPILPYRPLRRLDWALLGALVLLAVAIALFHREEDRLAPQVTVNRQEALQIARRYLQAKGVAVRQYRTFVQFEDEAGEAGRDYARSIHQERAFQQLQREYLGTAWWYVRFFRPLQREQWEVWLSPQGEVLTFARVLPEEAPGRRLPPAQARTRAEQYLREEGGYNLQEWQLIETDRIERPHRLDYAFTYEHRQHQLGEAKLRLRVLVQGDLPQDIATWLHIPEEWRFEREQFEDWTILALAWLLLLLLVLLGIVLVREWRDGTFASYSWSSGLKVGLFGTITILLLIVANWDQFMWGGYDTSTPEGVQLMMMSVALLLVILIGGGLLIGCYANMEPLWWRLRLPHLVPLSVWLKPSAWREMPADSPLRHSRALSESLIVVYLLALAAGLLNYASSDGVPNLHANHLWLEGVALAAFLTVLGGLVLIGAAGIYHGYLRSFWRVLMLAALFTPATLIGAGSWTEVGENLTDYGLGFLMIAALGYWLGRYLLQGNLFGWAAFIYLSMLTVFITDCWLVNDSAVRWQGVWMLPFGLLPVAGWLLWRRYLPPAPLPPSDALTEAAFSSALATMEAPRRVAEDEL